MEKAVIKGDIINSRGMDNPEKWLNPLKKLLAKWGENPQQWELVWGDSFQLEIVNPEEALHKALLIKALVKKIETIDVRMSIGIGEINYTGSRISESNGRAFVHAGEKFEKLKKDKVNLAIKSNWPDFDNEMNLYLRLAGIFMDKWSVSSAELMGIILNQPDSTQEEIGQKLGIKQNSVSYRWKRANADEILEVEKVYRAKIKQLMEVC